MWCLISQPNSAVFEVLVDPKSIGQTCLEKVCDYLGISSESDYFGLKYKNSKGEELWLNLRNPIDKQVCCHGQSHIRFSLRVKFWVPPHLLLQDTTKHIFYLNAKLDLLEKRLLPTNQVQLCRLIALIAQAETGDYDPVNKPYHIYEQAFSIISAVQNENSIEKQKIILEHEKCKGMKASSAKYWLLKEISVLEGFGEEVFSTKSNNCSAIGIGPHGMTVYKENKEKQSIPFTAIQNATSHKKTFKLKYLSTDNTEAYLRIKMDSDQAASGLYRAITEKHAFYSCETVRSAVTSQFIRDLKGTIVSIFNEDSPLGKKYVFDITRTCREVYDNARRVMYIEKQNYQDYKIDASNSSNEGDENRDSQESYVRMLTCKICMDKLIDTVFLPCAHVVACSNCAARCDRCPLCRTNINTAQKIFMPGEC